MPRDEILRNNEGYLDPTAGEALGNIRHEEKMEHKKVHTLIKCIKLLCELCGFKVIDRIVLRSEITGNTYN